MGALVRKSHCYCTVLSLMHTAQNMFGPAMDAVLEWLTTDPAVRGGDSVSAAVDCYDDGTSMTPQLAPRSVVDTLLGALSSFGLTSKRAPAVGDAGHAAENRAPSALVCGMVLHVLLASSPDLPLGLHNSVSAGSAADRNRSLFNPEWVEATADKASKNNICINLWGVAPFSSHVVGLSELSSLASKTGGKTYRFLLGTTPVAERYRLSLQLARALSAQYASRCVLKLRASQLVDLVDSSMMGHLTADPLLPGVYRVPCCSQDATMASFLDYRGGAEGTEHAEIQHLVVQVAFSYETLVEAEDDAFPFEVDSEDQSQCIDKDDGAGFYTGGSYCDPLSADTTAAISVAQPLGYASMPSNLLHPEEGSTIELASFDVKNQRSDFPIQSQDQVHSLPGNNRLGLPTFTFGEAESTPLPDEDYLNPDEAYRRFSEAVCRVSSDATFAKEYRAEMQSLKLKNKSSRRNGSNSSSDLSNVFAEVNLGFSHKKKLISVRRLRIITIAVDCVDKVPRLLSGTQPDVVAVLVTREVLYNVNVDSSDTINGGVVKLIGGLYEWCKNLTMCAAKGYLVSKLGRQFADRKKDGSKSEQFASLVKEAVEAASKDPITQTSLYIIFGAMSRIIGGHTDNNNALTIGVCISRYLGDSIDRISGGQSTLDSAIPARQKAHKSFSAESSQRSVGPPTFCFSDSFSEVSKYVCPLHAVLIFPLNCNRSYP